jgi:hypothetical protein
MRRIDRNLYRYAAEAVRRYPYDANRLVVLREILAARRGPDGLGPDAGAACGKGAPRLSPQEAAFDRMWDSGEYRRLSLRVSCMERLFGLLTNEEMRLLNLVFEELTWVRIAEVMNLSADTCKGKKWPKIVVKAARLFFGDLV